MTEAEQAFTEMRKVWRERDVPMLKEGRDPFAMGKPEPTEIAAIVAREYGLGFADLVGRCRLACVSEPRSVAMHLCRSLTKESLPRIGMIFGRDHSTVSANISGVRERMERDDEFAAKVLDVASKCRQWARAHA